MKKEIENVIMSIFQSIQVEEEEESAVILGEMSETLKSSEYDLKKPEMFNLMVGSKVERTLRSLAKTLHEPSMCKDSYKPTFIYQQYSFLEGNIEKLCGFKENGGCSGDKSRYILSMYLRYARTGEIETTKLEKEEFWKPKFGSNEDWMKYCDGLYRLYFGNPDEYLIAYGKLITSEVVKFKHLQHEWYIELDNQKIIHVSTTWDNKEFIPLEADGGYLVTKRRVKEFNFEEYLPKSDDKMNMFRGHVCVPKSRVKRIYSETKEVFV